MMKFDIYIYPYYSNAINLFLNRKKILKAKLGVKSVPKEPGSKK